MIRGRLAPSPTGALHLGNARTFLLAWLSVRAQKGHVVLRVEDLDGPRVKPGAVAFEDLCHGSMTNDVAAEVGDFVVRKGNGTPAYQLAVVVDDAAMCITEVVRGDDLISSTPRQLLLYQALALTPPAFRHVSLVVGQDGLRLAKRHGDTRITTFRGCGASPEQLVGMLAHWCGLAPPRSERMPRELVGMFDWQRVPRERIVWEGK